MAHSPDLTDKQRERDEARALLSDTPLTDISRWAVRALAAEAALERVRALADAWERDAAAACDGADHSGCPDCDGKVYAADLRAAIGGTR